MSEPTREQLIQQANLRADYNEAWERGKHWEDWQCRPWNSPNDWRETKCVPFSDTIGYEYRRTPEPPKPIVASVEGIVKPHGFLRWTENVNQDVPVPKALMPYASSYLGQRATLTLTIYPEGCEVPDTVAVPRAVVESILKWKDGPRADYDATLDRLAVAVKGGA